MNVRQIEVLKVVRDEGSVVLFAGVDVETAQDVTFACDHRLAQPLVDAIATGDFPIANIDQWQIIG